MNRRDKVVEIVAKKLMFGERDGRYLGNRIADALADAGLLAPDLPAPLTAANGNPVWRADNTLMVTRYPDGEIGMMISWEQEARYTPETARTQAALLLAAAEEEPEAHRER